VVDERPIPSGLTLKDLQDVCDRFTGDIRQVPPMVSAIKIGGRRLYKIAREGGEVDRKPRPISIQCFEVTEWNSPEAAIRVTCSSGAYVRTLCHDVGQQLGCGAVLSQLRRTHVGNYSLENAAPLDMFVNVEDVKKRLIPMDDALDLPAVCADAAQAEIVRSGGAISSKALASECPTNTGWVQIKDADGKLLAIALAQPTAMGARLQPKRVFSGR